MYIFTVVAAATFRNGPLAEIYDPSYLHHRRPGLRDAMANDDVDFSGSVLVLLLFLVRQFALQKNGLHFKFAEFVHFSRWSF